jgi:Ca2+-transporting ATPase
MHTILGKHWHHLGVRDTVELLGSDIQKGLDILEVKHRHDHFGPNTLTPQKGRGPLVRFLLQFNNPLIYILLASTVITVVLKDVVDAAVIFGAVLVNAIIGYLQESRAEGAIQALAQTMTTEATVIRAGKSERRPASELVPGDIVSLTAGDKVPADLRLIRSRDLQIAEAALTGESAAVQKDAEVTLPIETIVADRTNMAYASTLVTYGQGTGIVIATGDSTEVGRIFQLLSSAEELETPLTRKMPRFSRQVVFAILALSALPLRSRYGVAGLSQIPLWRL